MPDRRRSRLVLAVAVVVSLLLITTDYRAGDTGPLAALQRGVLTVFGPLQEGFADVVRPIGSFLGDVRDLGSLRDQVNQLEADNSRLRDETLLSQADVERENADLRALVAMGDRLDLQLTGAQVVALPPGGASFTVLIDAGGDQGLAQGMAVVTGDGLVGKVAAVAASQSRVELVTDPEAGYAVRLASSGEDGLLSGRGARPFELQPIDPELVVAAGEEVVTKAYAATRIPDGIPVGVIEGERAGPGQPLAVRPYVDFSRLSVVAVVLGVPEQPAGVAEDTDVGEPGGPRPPQPTPSQEAPIPSISPDPDETATDAEGGRG